jgi:comEA protein
VLGSRTGRREAPTQFARASDGHQGAGIHAAHGRRDVMVRIGLWAGALACAVMLGMGERTRIEAAGQDAKAPAAAPAPINLNVATAADLEKLPGIGAAMATRILEYRQKSGGFKKIEELMNIQGIGERNFLRLKPLVTVVPPKSAER